MKIGDSFANWLAVRRIEMLNSCVRSWNTKPVRIRLKRVSFDKNRTDCSRKQPWFTQTTAKKKKNNETKINLSSGLQAEFAIAIAMQNNTRPAYFHIHDWLRFAQLSNRSHNIPNIITFRHVRYKTSVSTSADRYQTKRNSRRFGQSIQTKDFQFSTSSPHLYIVYSEWNIRK